jgi:hypothetical protein
LAEHDALAIDKAIDEISPAPTRDALARIEGTGRKLLALRSYLRAGGRLEQRWSWTDEEIAAFEGSPGQLALLAEISKVSRHFAKKNPSYTLYANTRVRSLDTQIKRWNTNRSVGEASSALGAALLEQFDDAATEKALKAERLDAWLRTYVPRKRAGLAAPGLSRHGQAHAIDFQVMQDGKIIASTDVTKIESLWLAGGWADKLAQSIAAAGPSFHGPLETPHEPWHYDYKPQDQPEIHRSAKDIPH